MASPGMVCRRNIEELPDEILLTILAYLHERTITALQLVSRRFRVICRDDRLWKSRCFDESVFYSNFWYRQALLQSLIDRANAMRGQTAAAPEDESVVPGAPQPATSAPPASESPASARVQSLSKRLHSMRAISKKQVEANWDPSYPGERVSWYDEYIQRYGPVATSWFQSPYVGGDVAKGLLNEVRGLALFTPDSARRESVADPLLAVSPLEDGTVCLFDVSGTSARRGALLGSSRPGLLYSDGHGSDDTRQARRIDSGVTESVSVDSQSNRGFFAVQNQLIEVDLQRLDVVSQQSFECTITTLSEASPGVPLTVGTSLGLHLYDHRAHRVHSPSYDEKLDLVSRIFSNDPLLAHAPLSQPTPLCIHHLPEAGVQGTISNDIYVAGRYPSILWYDRRQWPHILDTFPSGARIATLTSIPHPFLPDVRLRRWGGLTQEKVFESKSVRGQTLIAAGEYETKGSIELIGLRSGRGRTRGGDGARRQKLWDCDEQSVLQNRQSVSSSKVFSAATHGTRIVFSDGGGDVKWFERDGLTEVRRHNIGSPEDQGRSRPSIFRRSAETGDFARKLLSTQTRHASSRRGEGANNDDIVFWTGERLGVISFTSREGFASRDFEEAAAADDAEAQAEEEGAEMYSEMMMRALELQADEVRLTRGLMFP